MKRAGITTVLDLGEGLQVRVDVDGLVQIVENLLSNVEKYGGEDSQLKVRSVVDNGRAVLQVIDSGRGVSARNRERIFKPFARLSRRVNEGVSGSGLGLAISRDLARAMNGELVCRERPDGRPGACFELRLELAEEKVVPFETKVS